MPSSAKSFPEVALIMFNAAFAMLVCECVLSFARANWPSIAETLMTNAAAYSTPASLSTATVLAINGRSLPFSTKGAAAFTASTSSNSGVSISPSFIVHEFFVLKSTCCPLTSSAPSGKCSLDSSASDAISWSCDIAAEGAIHPASLNLSPCRQSLSAVGDGASASALGKKSHRAFAPASERVNPERASAWRRCL